MDDLSRLAAMLPLDHWRAREGLDGCAHDEPMIAPVYSLVSVDAELFDAYLAATGKRLSRLNDGSSVDDDPRDSARSHHRRQNFAPNSDGERGGPKLRVAAGQIGPCPHQPGQTARGRSHALRLANTQLGSPMQTCSRRYVSSRTRRTPDARGGLVDLVAYWRKGGTLRRRGKRRRKASWRDVCRPTRSTRFAASGRRPRAQRYRCRHDHGQGEHVHQRK